MMTSLHTGFHYVLAQERKERELLHKVKYKQKED